MALEACFKKLASKKDCVVCGKPIPLGIYSRHLNTCISNPNDEECKVLQILTREDKKRIAIENAIVLDDSESALEMKNSTVKVAATLPQALQKLTAINSGNENSNFCKEKETSSRNNQFFNKGKGRSCESKLETTDINCVNRVHQNQQSLKRAADFDCSVYVRKRTTKISIKEENCQRIKKNDSNEKPSKSVEQEVKNVIAKKEKLISSFHSRVEGLSSEASTSGSTTGISKSNNDDGFAVSGKSLEEIVSDIQNYLDVCDSKIIGGPVSHSNELTYDRVEQLTSPYYLVLFNYIFKKVFDSASNDVKQQLLSFWKEKLHIFHKFISLSVELIVYSLFLNEVKSPLSVAAKKLLIRLFLRKRNWLFTERLKYDNIASDLVPLFNELVAAGLVDSSASHDFELVEALQLLQAPSLKIVAKQFKLDFSLTKEDLLQKLLDLSKQKNVFGLPNTVQMLKLVKKELGCCFRLRETVMNFFNCVFTLFSPSDMCSSLLLDQPATNLASQLLFVMLEVKLGKIRFPAPSSPPLFDIYKKFEDLQNYVEAKKLESEIAYLMAKSQWEEIPKLSAKASRRFEERFSINRNFYQNLPQHCRRHTDCWVYTRCISHGVEAYQRLRKYEDAVRLLRYLLYTDDFKIFLMSARGSWWDRLALNLDSHLKVKSDAFEAIEAGLNDSALGDKDRLLLQMRGVKLNKMWKGPLLVKAPRQVNISGLILGKALGDQRTNRFTIERNGEYCECSVENVALQHYIENEGFKEGVHAEGAVWHFVFGLLCYDVIFDHKVENVWFCETQDHPADLNTRNLYMSRKAKFDERFKEIEKSEPDELIQKIVPVYEEYYGETNSECSWECFSDVSQLKRFLCCCRPSMLAAVFRRMTTDYRNCRSGFPDLTLWNDSSKSLAVVEVKGPGDKLSAKQILWLQYFEEHKVKADVCHVAACNPKRMS